MVDKIEIGGEMHRQIFMNGRFVGKETLQVESHLVDVEYWYYGYTYYMAIFDEAGKAISLLRLFDERETKMKEIAKTHSNSVKKFTLSESGMDSYTATRKYTLREILELFTPNIEFAEQDEIQEWQNLFRKPDEELELGEVQDFVERFVNNPDGIRYHNYQIQKW